MTSLPGLTKRQVCEVSNALSLCWWSDLWNCSNLNFLLHYSPISILNKPLCIQILLKDKLDKDNVQIVACYWGAVLCMVYQTCMTVKLRCVLQGELQCSFWISMRLWNSSYLIDDVSKVEVSWDLSTYVGITLVRVEIFCVFPRFHSVSVGWNQVEPSECTFISR